jgi:hypothetical protein
MSQLFEPLRIGDLQLDNRIIIAPMCQYSATEGTPGDWHLIHLGHLALSGAGLLILEATAVSPEGRITPWDLGLYSDASEEGLSRVLGAIRSNSPIKIGMQLAHAGRKASSRAPWEGGAQIRPQEPGGWKALAPSAVPHSPSEDSPLALDSDGLRTVREAFSTAARRAARLGLDGLEIHAAHGYLLHQFLSPLANRRDDAYGAASRTACGSRWKCSRRCVKLSLRTSPSGRASPPPIGSPAGGISTARSRCQRPSKSAAARPSMCRAGACRLNRTSSSGLARTLAECTHTMSPSRVSPNSEARNAADSERSRMAHISKARADMGLANR